MSSGGSQLDVEHGAELAERLSIGASLAVAGVCLTVVEQAGWGSRVELSPETLERTTLGGLCQGARVNLEPALRLGDALGGHWVQGHVDGVTTVLSQRDLEDHRLLTFALPENLDRYFVEKGSVTLDGVSLTIASLDERSASVALIPHTLEVTTLGASSPGDRMNLEIDVLAKYVERAVAPYR